MTLACQCDSKKGPKSIGRQHQESVQLLGGEYKVNQLSADCLLALRKARSPQDDKRQGYVPT
jgi:hypothetical protein